MKSHKEIIHSILALYCVAVQGDYETDYDNLKEAFYALAEECKIPGAMTKRIWGALAIFIIESTMVIY